MIALTLPRPIERGINDETLHWYCCDTNRALCGADLTDVPETERGDECVVCADLDDHDRACSPTCPIEKAGNA